jgi:hypothetical protein
LGLISYSDYTNRDLKVAHCSDVECSSATLTTLDGANMVGDFTSITTNINGYGIISYIDLTNNDLMLARCTNALCSSSTLKTIDTGSITDATSITLDISGLPIISYHTGAGDLKVAHCQSTISCNTVSTYTVDNTGNVGQYSSITIGSDGYPIISYYDYANKDLKVAHCEGAACSSSTLYTVADYEDVGKYNSIIIGSDGLPIIAFNNYISSNNSGRLYIAHCSTISCDKANVHSVVNGFGQTAMYTSIAIGMDGIPIISYYDDDPGTLQVLHCANTLCGSYRRGR